MDSSTRPSTIFRSLNCWALLLSLLSTAACQRDLWLKAHNDVRRPLGIPDLVWNDTLVTYATNYGKKLAADCVLKHSSNNPYGENLFWSTWASTPAEAVNDWVDERQYYNYNTNTCAANQVCGHYTQVVWRKSARLGCASAPCNGGGTVSVCEYDPPGNYISLKPY